MARLPATLASLDAAASVLVVKPSSLGDIVHTLPAVAWLKQERPDLRIHWLANNEWTPLVQGSALLESVIAFPRQELRGLAGLFRARRWMHTFAHTMRQHPIVLALDFQGLLRSAWLARRCGASHVLGLGDAREGARFFYTASVPVDGVHHAVDRYLALVRSLGPRTGPTAALDGDWLAAGKPIDRFNLQDFILLHPFSRGGAKSLDWPAVSALAAAWQPRALVVAGQATFPPPQRLPAHVTNLVNQTSLDQLIWLMRRARFVVSVDSGPMHVASALHRPLLALHTWSDPRKVGPYDSAAWVWKAGRILHRPEVDQSLATRTAPLDKAALDQIAAFVGNHSC